MIAKQQQNGVIAPLDLAIRDSSRPGEPQFNTDLTHLSPVYETRTPSPTVVRKFDGSVKGDRSSAHQTPPKEPRAEPLKQGPKLSDPRNSGANDTKPGQASHQARQVATATTAVPGNQEPQSIPSHSRAAGQSPPQPKQQAPATTQPTPNPHPKVNGSKENGHVRGAKSESHNSDGGWQRATKNRKKGSDGKHQSNGFIPSEEPPKFEADRKGG
jgi:hypothetical protein